MVDQTAAWGVDDGQQSTYIVVLMKLIKSQI